MPRCPWPLNDADFARIWSGPGMPGLQVGPARWNGVYLPAPGSKAARQERLAPLIPPDRSSFHHYFAPIYPALAEFYLAGLPGLWWREPYQTDPDFRALVELLPRGDYVPPHTFFPEFAHHTGEGDWMDLYFLRKPPCSNAAFYQRIHDPAFFTAHVDVWIRNVDGAFWLLFTRDRQILDTTRHHLATLPGAFSIPTTTEADL